jgi:hypothetical protein
MEKEYEFLRKISVTFPDFPTPMILRSNLIDWLYDRFTPDRRVIIVQGVDGSGKTNLLAQFALTFSDRSVSFFIKKDIWSYDPQRYLEELCNQINYFLYGEESSISLPENYYQLKQYFNKLYRQLAKRGRALQKSFFFIVDGLEWVSKTYVQETIIDLLPSDPLPGIYLLASSEKNQEFSFEFEQYAIPFFSPTEMADYLGQIGVDDKTNVSLILKVCNGMPGYLDQIRRELTTGRLLAEVISDLPRGFNGLLEREWRRIKNNDDCLLNALSIATFSELPLLVSEIAQIVDMSPTELDKCWEGNSWVMIRPDKIVNFVTDAHKKFLAEKLKDKSLTAQEALISFYENNPISDSAQLQLPILYKNTNKYDALKSFINANNLSRILRHKQSTILIRRTLSIASDAAKQKKDWAALAHYSLLGAAFKTISIESPMSSELEALLSLDKHQEAFAIAYQAVLPEDRLELLAKVCNYLKKKGQVIPYDVLADIDALVSDINPTGSFKERLVEIAANLFYVHNTAAIDLVEKVSSTSDSGKAIDILLVALTLKLESEIIDPDSQLSSENLKSRITDQSLQQFVRVNSPLVSRLTPTQVITDAENIDDISTKLFMLRSWCNANRDNSEAYIVIDYALRTMTASPHAPSMRHLRQFAEPLVGARVVEIQSFISRFELLKETAIQKPSEEVIRLELLLATLDAHTSKDKALQRLLDTYASLSLMSDKESLCYCLVRFLMSLPQIDEEDSLDVKREIESRLPNEYQTLLNNSADHYEITKKILGALTNYKPEMAISFAEKLNTSDRRDEAFSEILRIFSDQEVTQIDLAFIDATMSRIQEQSQRDNVFVKIMEKFSEHDAFLHYPQSRRYLGLIESLEDPIDRCLTYAFAIRMMEVTDLADAANDLFLKLIESWNLIDMLWSKVDIGFEIVSIIAPNSSDKATTILYLSREERSKNPLSSKLISELYINSINLGIRAFSDILKDKDYNTHCQKLIDAITLIPSREIRCHLLGDLALRHFLADKNDEFRTLMENHVLEIINHCKEQNVINNIVVDIAPCLFEYERELLRQEARQMPEYMFDEAIKKVILYIMSGNSISDPIDLEALSVSKTLNFSDALKICELLKLIHRDELIYMLINNLVNLLVKPDHRKPGKEKCIIIERQALIIATELINIIEQKLPDQQNIQHKGYKIACQGHIARLRSSAVERATNKWQSILPSLSALVIDVKNIPNIADKIFVMALLADTISQSDPVLAHELLSEAGKMVNEIPTFIDRGNRLQVLASTWKSLNDKNSAKHFLLEAMNTLREWEWGHSRDHITGMILQQAHELDPEFAASLTSTVDNPVIVRKMENFLAIQELKDRPDKTLTLKDRDEQLHIRGLAASNLLRSLCSGRKTIIQTEEKLAPWLSDAFDAKFKDAYFIEAWTIENQIMRTSQLSYSALQETFRYLLNQIQMSWMIGQILTQNSLINQDVMLSNPVIPESLQIYPVGTTDNAIRELTSWIGKHTKYYIKVYDPYFAVEDLEVIRFISYDARVHLLTLRKSQVDKNDAKPDDNKVIKSYQQKYIEIFGDQGPEIHFYIFGTITRGDGPIHDRYYISSDGIGIQMGTSTGGLGNKDSVIRIMDTNEAQTIEATLIDKMLINPPYVYKEERLNLLTFTVK